MSVDKAILVLRLFHPDPDILYFRLLKYDFRYKPVPKVIKSTGWKVTVGIPGLSIVKKLIFLPDMPTKTTYLPKVFFNAENISPGEIFMTLKEYFQMPISINDQKGILLVYGEKFEGKNKNSEKPVKSILGDNS
jgi:hypothetical protein